MAIPKMSNPLSPEDTDVQALKEKQAQVDALKGQSNTLADPPERTMSTAPVDRVSPMAKFGSRPGEKRLDYALKPQPTAVYDNGGDVAMSNFRSMAPSLDAPDARDAANAAAQQPQQQSNLGANIGSAIKGFRKMGEDNAAAKVTTERGNNVMQPAYMPKLAAPVYDEGTDGAPLTTNDVDVNDGKHHPVYVEDGEKILNPRETAEYNAQKGAPSDFGGRVIPNPKGVKPEWDSEHAVTPMKYPGGAQMRVDNAPLSPAAGDTSNPPAADIGAVEPREIKAEVPSEAEQKKAAAEKVASPGAQTETSAAPAEQLPEKPKQLPTASHEERVAVQTDINNAMGKGVQGLADLGTAKIHAKQLGLTGETEEAPAGSVAGAMKAPKEFNQGTPAPTMPKMGEAAPAAPAPAAPAEAPAVTSEQGADFKTRLKQLELDHAKALALRTPEGKVQADYIQEQINDLHKNNPWGTAGNHPGFMGKLGHVAAKIGNIAGNVTYPTLMNVIPGTELNKQTEERRLQAQTAQDVASQAAADKADKEAGADWKVSTGAVGPNGRVMLENSKTGETKEAPEGFVPYNKPAHLGDQAAYIEQWYKDHKDAIRSTENDDKAIEAYGTAKAAAAQENKAKGKVYYYNTPEGRRGYTYNEAKAAGLNPDDGYAVSPQQADKDRKANDSYVAMQDQMQQYRQNIARSVGQLLPSDVESMSSVIEAADKPDYVSKIVTGVIDDFYGKPVQGYNEKVMHGALTKDAYDKMSPAARQLVSDYFTTLMSHFANVKAVLGQVPRNEKLITTEMNMIPKPYLTEKEAEPAFNNYKAWLDTHNSQNVKFGKPQGNTPAPAAAAPSNQGFQMTDEEKNLINTITLPNGSHPAAVHKDPVNGKILVWDGESDYWTDAAGHRQ